MVIKNRNLKTVTDYYFYYINDNSYKSKYLEIVQVDTKYDIHCHSRLLCDYDIECLWCAYFPVYKCDVKQTYKSIYITLYIDICDY